ncbi:alpha/beta fold hydrolase [Streptosporangium sp. NPDC002721]|uniref:alpha/beta fold hydrolase n=1 Tax=Streptosporangium sp. NPDC002721 TaxID=3366188 RepID=UPI0036C5B7AF
MFDHRIGGACDNPAAKAVSRDRQDEADPDPYDICYVNAFQTQPIASEVQDWRNRGLTPKNAQGEEVVDGDWREILLDITTDAKRRAVASVVNGWIDGCADAGYQAVEPDNLDAFDRSEGLIDVQDTVAHLCLLIEHAYSRGPAIARKNALGDPEDGGIGSAAVTPGSTSPSRGTEIVTEATAGESQPLPAASSSAADLTKFYSQKLDWSGCAEFATSKREAEILADPKAQCARLSVPLDYDDPKGATASVAVLRVKARGESKGSVVFNPGGPGGSGVLGGLAVSRGLAKSRISEAFDIVGFDPRGVGATKPAADCYSEKGATRGDEVFPTLTLTVDLTEEDTRAVFDRCAEGSGGAKGLASMGTRTTARDMDVLRAVLGDEKLTLLGQSYGTRLGSVYAEQFPQRVRAMILDGAFDPGLGTIERRLAAYGGFQRAFEVMAATCAKDASCPLGTDPKAWTSRFQALVQPLRDKPVPALGQELDFDGAVGGVMAGLYSPTLWPTVVRGLNEVRQGRGDSLMRLVQDLGGGAADNAVNGNVTEALFAINCMDERRLTPQDVARLHSAGRRPVARPGVRGRSLHEPGRRRRAGRPGRTRVLAGAADSRHSVRPERSRPSEDARHLDHR